MNYNVYVRPNIKLNSSAKIISTVLIATTSTLLGILFLAVFAFMGLMILFSRSPFTVIDQQIWSPDKQNSLLVVTKDSGALGGGKVVYLTDKFLGVVPRKTRVYHARWGATIETKWLSDRLFTINGKEYLVEDIID